MMPMRAVAAVVAFLTLTPVVLQPVPGDPPGRLADVPLTHVGIVVPDVARAARTYADVLGVSVPPVQPVKDVRYPAGVDGDRASYPRVATFALKNLTLDLLEPQGGASPWREQLEKHGAGLHHIAFGVSDTPGHVRYLQSVGGRVRVGGEAGGSITYVDFVQQLGFMVALREGPQASGGVSYPAASFANNTVLHVSAIVPDVERAGQVAADVLGVELPPTTVVKMGSLTYPASYRDDRAAAPKHVTFRLPNILLELTEPQGGASPWRDQLDRHGPSLHHLAFRVGDMAEGIRYLEAKGGRLVLGGPGVGYAYVDLRPEPLGLTLELNGPSPRPAN